MFVWYLFPTLGIRMWQRIEIYLTTARQKKMKRAIARATATDSLIDVCDMGVTIHGAALPVTFLWSETERLELVWTSMGDPIFGWPNEVEWLITTGNQRQYRIDDNEAHRYLLIPAFVKHLRNYAFNYDMFKMHDFSTSDGSYLCWNRQPI